MTEDTRRRNQQLRQLLIQWINETDPDEEWDISFKRKESPWISVEDQIPEDDQTVFVLNNKSSSMMPIKAYYDHGSETFYCLETYQTILVDATHWMPLPEPPKD